MYFDNAKTRTSKDEIVRMVVCSAIKNKYGRLIVGARHYDSTMHSQLEQAKRHGEDWSKGDIDQGFIDQFGKFMDRNEAWKVAMAADQIRYRCGGDTIDGGTLFSENLY